MSRRDFDVVVVGAGIAGASVASRLAGLSVAVLEQESQPGYHSTGRSAAIFSQVYGSSSVRALTRATGPFLLDPPKGFADNPLLRRCGVLFIARADQRDQIEALSALDDVTSVTRRVSPTEALNLLSILKPGYVSHALVEDGAAEIEVHALHHGYLRQVTALGGELFAHAAVTGLSRANGRWQVETPRGLFSADVVVNAAGAWADGVAELAGIEPLHIQPLRRTAVIVDAPPGSDPGRWPMTVDIDEQFYLKPDAGRILISPADETPVDACDVQPEEYDVAVAVHRVERATTLEIKRIQNKWAGLRCFAPDRNLVIGYDVSAPGFFWMAGQGGYGIQTSFGAAELGAALLAGRPVPGPLIDLGLQPEDTSPARFAPARPAVEPFAA
ncbi:MAG TPA: FAD-dependent oxidoreductase [Allosphingosinicella sp.]|jgi:D-arginine dehydrogenase